MINIRWVDTVHREWRVNFSSKMGWLTFRWLGKKLWITWK